MIDLQLTSATDMSITVFDMYGKKVAQQFVAGINGSYLQQLNISGAGNGVYFLQLEANGQTVNKKIVVQ